ncbi:hypothetical protein LTR37_018328 [Vermiconidia calcicola]|uniref:Uncharacterized protein n=1 Tax=Vermiconidia calcicola TaxID=1690605 RepID=A0ACC3MHI5_9PEZI|nr:hypothetical protein LTR37_018328 [Vermiconidia calcicola]
MASASTVQIKRLQLPSGILLDNIFGKPQEQPAYVTLTLHLRTSFQTAADKDALDESTIHYGQLAKGIRKHCTGVQARLEILKRTISVIRQMAEKADGTSRLTSATFCLHLPKSSLYGDGWDWIIIMHFSEAGEPTSMELTTRVEGMRFMALIGVNDYERTSRQPLVAKLVIKANAVDVMEHIEFDKIERRLGAVFEDSSFETLEALAEHAVSEIEHEYARRTYAPTITLRLEKPKAIAFADAAVVEVTRDSSKGTSSAPTASSDGAFAIPVDRGVSLSLKVDVDEKTGKAIASVSTEQGIASDVVRKQLTRLNIIKPYV